ncbi:hypothetical protein CCMSSC00406_0004259 [Pleurotus cornucopiae]|uniref:Uncharacterized protein n=1 Tax=Pleurotus cornucopiae TaxID=5321 RepID=A0ACB7J9E9_PLECO|nr:hypothetical protein CCMSSC00406_0004259 [Pleurotus cornucopiae]
MGGMNREFDPLDIVTAPPPGETPEQRASRERREAEAKRISDGIDEDIRVARAALKKQKSVLRVLLLGQAESGKSTTLKNFRLKYAYQQWLQERASWRAVIQLNVVRSALAILDALQAEINNDPLLDPGLDDDDESLEIHPTHHASPASSRLEFASYASSSSSSSPSVVGLSDKHKLLALRLSPLRRIETVLKKRLGAGSEEVRNAPSQDMQATPFESPQVPPGKHRRAAEFVVRTWSDALQGRAAANHHTTADEYDSEEVTEVIARCQEDLITLWNDPVVRKVLSSRRIPIEHSAGFFLDDLQRIAVRSYEPSDDDVVRARLRTVGVQEHRILFEQDPRLGHEFGREWLIYDVGGARTMRHAWLPFFDNVNAVIFLAPVSCFDERLDEDHKVNRLEDSFILWKAVVSTKLLQKTTMIVFLNKCDLLKKKLKSGVYVKKHLPSYGERPNDAASVVKYLRDKFKDTLKQHSPEHRVGYLYPTSVTDTKATSTTLRTVRDGIMREHLKNADFV